MTAPVYLSSWKYSPCLFLSRTAWNFLVFTYLSTIQVKSLLGFWCQLGLTGELVLYFIINSIDICIYRFPPPSLFRSTSFQVDLKTWNSKTLKSYIPSFLYYIWFCLYHARVWVLIVSNWDEIMAETLNMSNSLISPICSLRSHYLLFSPVTVWYTVHDFNRDPG